MIAIIRDNKFIYLENLTSGAEEAIIDWFSVRDPSKFARSDEWDGWYRRYDVKKQRLQLPFLKELQRCCNSNNVPLDVIDERDAPVFPVPQKDQITDTFLDGIKLEHYQVRALHAVCDNEIGIVAATTGAGKTELICGIIKMFRCPSLVITEQIVVLNQIIERLGLRNVVHNNDIGQFCYGHMPDNNLVIVGSIQSVSTPSKPDRKKIKISEKRCTNLIINWIEQEESWRNTGSFPGENDVPHLRRSLPNRVIDYLLADPNNLQNLPDKYFNMLLDHAVDLELDKRKQWYKTRLSKAREIQKQVKKCDLLLVDEADLATTQQYARLFKHYFVGRRRFGFSGTPFDKDKPVRNMFLREHLGSVITEATRQEVQAAGRIIPISFYMIGVGADGDRNDGRAYDIAIAEEIIENNKFHKMVSKIVAQYSNDGTLILIDSVSLGQSLEEIIPNSKFIYGKTRPKERKKVLTQFENRELKCLIGSKILKRGLDLKGGCENLIIIGGGAKWSEFDQKIGRAVRLNKRGHSRVFGFFFLNNKYLYKHSRENLKVVIDMGYPTKVLINGKIIDGKKFVKSRYRLPR